MGQSGSNTFNTGPGVFPVWCRAHLALMTGAVIVQDFDLTLSNSNLFAYAATSTPFANLGTLTGQPTTVPPGTAAGISAVPYNNNVALSCVAVGTNPPNTCTLSPNNPQPGTPVSFTPTMSHPTVANFNFKIQGVGTDLNGLTHSQNVALHIVNMTYNTTPAPVTVAVTGTANSLGFNMTTAGTFPNADVTFSCASTSPVDPGLSCSGSFPVCTASCSTANVAHNGLTIQVAAANAIPGAHTVTLSADPGSGLGAKTATFTVNVQGYTLVVGAAPATDPGVPVTFNGTLTSTGGYNFPVDITCQGVPAQVTCTPLTTPVTPTAGGAPFSVQASASAAGNYSFSIQGVGQDAPSHQTHSQMVTLNVGSVTLGAPSPSTISAVPGNPSNKPASFTANATGYSGPLALDCPVAPTGVTCSFNPASPINISPGSPATFYVTLNTTGATPVGNGQSVTVRVTPTGLSAQTQILILNVIAGAGSADLELKPITHASTPDPVAVGKPVNFDVPISNHGPNTANGVTVSLSISSGATITTSSPGWSCSSNGNGSFNCTLASLANGASSTLRAAAVGTSVARALTVTANVSSTASDPGPTPNSGANTAQRRLLPLARPNLVPMIP